MIKKITLLITLAILTNVTNAQRIRIYPESFYAIEKDGKSMNKTGLIKILWEKDDASHIDNINAVSYPDGYFVLTTFPKYKDNTKEGKPIYQFVAKDEDNREITGYIMKNDQTLITFGLVYGDVIIGFSVNLLEYYYQK